MLLENPKAGCFEMLRVLKVGGYYAVAVWDECERNTLFFSLAKAFTSQVLTQHKLNVNLGSRLARPFVLPNLLKECGASKAATELFAFNMKFSSFQKIWTLVQDSGVFDAQLGSLPVPKQLAVKEHLSNLLCRFQHNGGYLILTAAVWYGESDRCVAKTFKA